MLTIYNASCHNALISTVKAEHSYFFYLISFGIFISLVVLGIIIKYRKNIVNNIKNYKEYLLPNIIKIITYTLLLTNILYFFIEGLLGSTLYFLVKNNRALN